MNICCFRSIMECDPSKFEKDRSNFIVCRNNDELEEFIKAKACKGGAIVLDPTKKISKKIKNVKVVTNLDIINRYLWRLPYSEREKTFSDYYIFINTHPATNDTRIKHVPHFANKNIFYVISEWEFVKYTSFNLLQVTVRPWSATVLKAYE